MASEVRVNQIQNRSGLGTVTFNENASHDGIKVQGAIGIGSFTTAERNAGIGTAAGSLIYNTSTTSVDIYNGTSWYTLNVSTLGTSGNPASSGVALWDAGFRESGLYYVDTANSGAIQVYVDLTEDSVDSTDSKAGWMLVGSWGTSYQWRNSANSSSDTFSTTVRNCFSSSHGDHTTKFFRVKVASSLATVPGSSIADWYYYKSSGVAWKRWWTTDGTTVYTSTSGNNGGTVVRDSLIEFTHAHNLKYDYTQSNQIWNNLGDSGGRNGNWDTALTTSGNSCGWDASNDGSLAILTSDAASSNNTAGQDCNINNAKFGLDDTTNSYGGGSSGTDNVGQTPSISGHDTNLWIFIK